MKISSIQTIVACLGRRNHLFVKVLTDAGITGIGEAYSVGPDLATKAAIDDFAGWLVGEDPTNVEHLWAKMYNFSRFPGGSVINSAISGIEMALWDVAGKAAGLPVCKLLGGRTRDKVRVYGHARGITAGDSPEETAEHAQMLIAKYGYTAVKIGPHPKDSDTKPWAHTLRYAEAKMRAVREAVGDDVEIGVDAHARVWEPFRAVELAEVLKPYRPFFLEEPLRPENIEAMAKLKQRIDIPLATGEDLYTKYEFRDLLVADGADIIQPDICVAGGFLEMKKIAAMAEAFYVTVAPHNPMGPLATAVNVHLAASIPNFLILEYIPDDEGPRRDVLREPMKVVNGYIPVPDKPGWGVELNEEALVGHPYEPWHRNFLYREDGSVAFV
ncbi:MAG: galactonate dehydratase [Chloroflexi bacterium]|nr:galactonate dehydratase [Chloroflexota bacterium]